LSTAIAFSLNCLPVIGRHSFYPAVNSVFMYWSRVSIMKIKSSYLLCSITTHNCWYTKDKHSSTQKMRAKMFSCEAYNCYCKVTKYGHVPLLFKWQGMSCFKLPKPRHIHHIKTLTKPLYIVTTFQIIYKLIKLNSKQWNLTEFCYFWALNVLTYLSAAFTGKILWLSLLHINNVV